MTVFIDTSALVAVLDADDLNSATASRTWESLVASGAPLVCHNYILVEAAAVIQRRIGLDAVRTFEEDIVPVLEVVWVDADVHEAAAGAHLAAARRSLSLVDCVSFEVMRRNGIKKAFAFDDHFRERGFETI